MDASRPEARQALQQAKQQRERLASPQAKDDRRRSGSRYRKLGARRALRVGQQMHRAVLRDRTPRPLAAARKRGMVVARYPSAYAAVLRPRKGAGDEKLGVMAMSTLPIRSRDSAGHTRLVDLSLQRQSDGWVPDNARTKLWIGDRVSDGFRVSAREIGVAPLDVAEQTVGTRSGDAVFFANSAKDADHIVRVTPAGAESLVQLRSTDSPERFRYRIDLPVGGALRELSDGSIVISRNGRRVGTITKPTAWDADQQPVPVTTTLRGNVLTLDVAHRGRDIRYPAIVDPNYVDLLQYRWYANGANAATNQYWSFATNQPSQLRGIFGNFQHGLFGQTNGLYALSYDNQIFPGGTYGYWRFAAPGTTSVLQAEWTQISHIAVHNGPAPCIDYGLIYNTTAWKTHGVQCTNFTPGYRLSCWDCNDYDGFSYDASVTGAQFGAGIYATTIANISDYLGESTIYLADPEDPTVTITNGPPADWTDNPNATISATASDPGLGVESMEITGAGTTNNSACLYAGPCPNTMSRSASVASLNLPDGNNTVAVTARDASYYAYRDAAGNMVSAKHESSATAPVKLDRQPPEIALSGTLNDARNGFIGPDETVTLQAVAIDGALAPATAQRSGATSITATLDGQPMTNTPVAAPCTRPEGSCTLTLSTTLAATEIEALDDTVEHTVQITATDALGHTSTDGFTFRTESDVPDLTLAGGVWDSRDALISEPTYDLDIEAGDGSPDAPGSGIQSITVSIDDVVKFSRNQACPLGNCALSDSFTFVSADYADGPHDISVTATDQLGLSTEEVFEVTSSQIAVLPPDNLAVGGVAERRIDGAAVQDQAGRSVATLGDVNGDGRDDYAIGAPGAATNLLRLGSGAVYVVYGGASDRVDLAALGSNGYRIDGAAIGAGAGTAVAAGGDINGDGLADLIIGAPSPLGLQGNVHVVFGAPSSANVDLNALGGRGFRIQGPLLPNLLGLLDERGRFGGELTGPRVGVDAASADVNGDGRDDLVIGSAAEGRNGRALSGSTYVIFGKTDGATVDTAALGAQGFRIDGAEVNDRSGTDAGVVGDVNGDDLADVAMTAPDSRAGAGTAYVVLGKQDTATVNLAGLGAAGYAITGAIGDRLGSSIAGAGDLDNDGYADVVIGGSGAFVAFGQDVTTPIDLQASEDGYRIAPPADSGTDGSRVSGAGDLNEDGTSDVLVGFPAAQSGRGAVYALLSRPGGNPYLSGLALDGLAGQRGSRINADAAGDRVGTAVDAIDTGATGEPGILIGAPQSANNSRSASGSSYVVPVSRLASQGTVAAAQAADPGAVRTRNNCYPNATPAYTFSVPLTDLPKCRRTAGGKREVTRTASKGGYKGEGRAFKRSKRQGPIGGNIRQSLRTGKKLNRNDQRTELFDSDGSTVGFLRQSAKRPTEFTLFGPTGNEVARNNSRPSGPLKGTQLKIELEGRPCMATGSPADYALILVDYKPRQGVVNDFHVIAGLRVLIKADTLPDNAFSPNAANKAVISAGWLPCNRRLQNTDVTTYPELNGQPATYPFPAFVPTDRYQGRLRPGTSCKALMGDLRNKACGTQYQNYAFPRETLAGFPRLALVSESSTGIAGGGIARGILTVDFPGTARPPLMVNPHDGIAYTDHNVSCTLEALARWRFVGRGKLNGWVPYMQRDGFTRLCP